jgi:hypothetical protein
MTDAPDKIRQFELTYVWKALSDTGNPSRQATGAQWKAPEARFMVLLTLELTLVLRHAVSGKNCLH